MGFLKDSVLYNKINNNTTQIISVFLILLGLFLNISISVSQILLGILLLCLIISILYNKKNIIKDNPYVIFFLFYWLAVVLSTFFGSEYVNFWKGLFSPWTMLIFFVTYYFVSIKNYRAIIFIYAIGFLVMILSCYYYYYMYSATNYQYLRSKSIVASYMMTSHLLSIGIVFFAGLIISAVEKSKIIIFFYIALIIFAYYALLITATRTPIFASTLVIGLMLIYKLHLKGFIISIILFGVLIGYILTDDYMLKRFDNFAAGFKNPATSHGWRISLWSNSMVLFKDYFLFGIGEGAYGTLLEPLMPKGIDLPMSHAHNSFIMQLVVHGIVGFIAFLLFYGRICLSFLKNLLSSPYNMIGVAIILTFILESLTENNFGLSLSIMQFLFLLGLLLKIIDLEKKQ